MAIEAPALLGLAYSQSLACGHCRKTMLELWPVTPGSWSMPLLFVTAPLLPRGMPKLPMGFVFGAYTVLAIAMLAFLARRFTHWRLLLVAAAVFSSAAVIFFLGLLRA